MCCTWASKGKFITLPPSPYLHHPTSTGSQQFSPSSHLQVKQSYGVYVTYIMHGSRMLHGLYKPSLSVLHSSGLVLYKPYSTDCHAISTAYCVADGVGQVVVPHLVQYPSNQVLRGRSLISRFCNLISQLFSAVWTRGWEWNTVHWSTSGRIYQLVWRNWFVRNGKVFNRCFSRQGIAKLQNRVYFFR